MVPQHFVHHQFPGIGVSQGNYFSNNLRYFERRPQWFDAEEMTEEKPPFYIVYSLTILGDFLDFGHLFKAFGNNWFAQISHILRQFW